MGGRKGIPDESRDSFESNDSHAGAHARTITTPFFVPTVATVRPEPSNAEQRAQFLPEDLARDRDREP